MDTLAARVARRFAAGFDNAVNGNYFTLKYNATVWHLEESDEPIGGLVSFTDRQQLPAFEMPTLFKQLGWYVTSQGEQIQLLTLSPSQILAEAKLRDDKGPQARAKIIAAYDSLIEQAAKQYAAEGDSRRAHGLESVLRKHRKKLVWKPARR